MALTRSQETIVKAYERGFRVTDDGIFLNPSGDELVVKLRSKQRYPSKQVGIEGKKRNYYIHRLATYCFYRELTFKEGIQVRHLNGNVLDVSKRNLMLGTCSDNHMDKRPEVRSNSARIASISQKNRTRKSIRKLTDEQAKEVKRLIKSGTDCVSISKIYGVSDETIYQIKHGKTYTEITI